jgi:hypothetical protein
LSIKQRLKALEGKANPPQPWLVLCVEERPSPGQLAEIGQAEKSGRHCIVFVGQGNTAWMAGSNAPPPPWERRQ